MARRKREYRPAIDNYLKSIEYGRGGAAIQRELARCYFDLGNLGKADEHIKLAQKSSPHNRFVIDLQCTIAIRTGDLKGAEKALAVLERVDPSEFYQHRMSTFEQASGRADKALEFAERAVEMSARPQFEILANLANCQIEMGRLPAAGSTIADLQRRFPGTHHDELTGLRCKLEIRRGDVRVAEVLWGQIREKATSVHMGLRLSVLNKKSQVGGLSSAEEIEQQDLLGALGGTDWRKTERLVGSILTSDE
jgi:tetratricopeptide (TPR) repeat protein